MADETMGKTTAQPMGKKTDKTMIAVVAIVVVIIAIVALATVGLGKPSSSTTTAQQQVITTSILQNITVPSTTINPADLPTHVNFSSSNYFFTSADVGNFIGIPGNYSAYQSTTPGQLQTVIPPQLTNYSITGEYTISYNNTLTTQQKALNQLVLVTSKPGPLYSVILGQYQNYFNRTFLVSQGVMNITTGVNSTINGMTYSYSSFSLPVPGTNSVGAQTVMFGYKNNSVGFVQISALNTTTTTNAVALATVLAAHLN